MRRCYCGHLEDEHRPEDEGGACAVIIGDSGCGCPEFIDENEEPSQMLTEAWSGGIAANH